MTRRKSYRHSQKFAISEMCRNVVRFGSQGLSVPVFSLTQLVQSYVSLSCESKMRVQSRVKLPEVRISQFRVFTTVRADVAPWRHNIHIKPCIGSYFHCMSDTNTDAKLHYYCVNNLQQDIRPTSDVFQSSKKFIPYQYGVLGHVGWP